MLFEFGCVDGSIVGEKSMVVFGQKVHVLNSNVLMVVEFCGMFFSSGNRFVSWL